MLAKKKAFERDVLPADLPEQSDWNFTCVTNLIDQPSKNRIGIRDFSISLLDYLKKILSDSLRKDPTHRPSMNHICLLFSFWERHMSTPPVCKFLKDSSRQGFGPFYFPAAWLPMTAKCENLRDMFNKYMIWISQSLDLSQLMVLKYFMLVVINPQNGLSAQEIKSRVYHQVEMSLFRSNLPRVQIVSSLVRLALWNGVNQGRGVFAWCLLDCIQEACRLAEQMVPIPNTRGDITFWAWERLAQVIPAEEYQSRQAIDMRLKNALGTKLNVIEQYTGLSAMP